MLICIVCGKTIANTDPSTIRYGGCSACPLDQVQIEMDKLKKRQQIESSPEARAKEVNDQIGEVRCGMCKKKIEADMNSIYPFGILKRVFLKNDHGTYPADVCPECYKKHHDTQEVSVGFTGHFCCGEAMEICGQTPDGYDIFQCTLCERKE